MRVPEPSSRVLARFAPRMRSDLATSAAPGDAMCFPLRQPPSSLPDSPEVCKEFQEGYKSGPLNGC